MGCSFVLLLRAIFFRCPFFYCITFSVVVPFNVLILPVYCHIVCLKCIWFSCPVNASVVQLTVAPFPLLDTGASIPPKPMMHIACSPYFHNFFINFHPISAKFIHFPLFPQSLRFLT